MVSAKSPGNRATRKTANPTSKPSARKLQSSVTLRRCRPSPDASRTLNIARIQPDYYIPHVAAVYGQAQEKKWLPWWGRPKHHRVQFRILAPERSAYPFQTRSPKRESHHRILGLVDCTHSYSIKKNCACLPNHTPRTRTVPIKLLTYFRTTMGCSVYGTKVPPAGHERSAAATHRSAPRPRERRRPSQCAFQLGQGILEPTDPSSC
jgi:hypothetical protein